MESGRERAFTVVVAVASLVSPVCTLVSKRCSRTALLKSDCALDAPEQEPDAHQEERSQVVAGEAGQFPASSLQRGQPRAQAQVSGAVVSEAGKQIALLPRKHPDFVLRSAAHLPPGKVEMQSAHHVDAGVVFGDPELSTNPRVEVEQLVLALRRSRR
jgi:hypothetical protein